MPQDNMYSCKTNTQVNDGVPGTNLVNGAVLHNGCPTAARTSKRTPNGTENGNTPPHMVNGHINKKGNGYGRKTAPPRTIRKQRSMISAVTNASASGRVISAGSPDGVPVNGKAASLSFNSDQMEPERSHKADSKNWRRWKKFTHKKRDPEVNNAKIPTSQLMALHEEEDWEKEIAEVTVTGWEKMCFGICAYGPEDLLHFELRDMTLKQRDIAPQPVTAGYRPATHHPRPVNWSCYNVPVESGQFADADE